MAMEYLEKSRSSIGSQISEDMFPKEAFRLISRKRDQDDLVVLDVSTPQEFGKVRLENAINMNFFSSAFRSHLNALDKGKTYLVYCKVGGRSKLAMKQMKKKGFGEVYNIVGGTLLWKEEGLPFASGFDSPPRFSLCPVAMTVPLMRKIRRMLQSGYRALFGGRRSAAGFESE